MPLSPATRLGPYEILSPLGAGGMGEVYRARDTRLDRMVAIKILPEHLSRNPQLHERFKREARAISSLSHPHICALYDVGQQDGVDYLVMEYLEGETLALRLRKGPLPPDHVLQIAIQITDALDTAHKHAVIHRDLKPGNIMLTKSGAKLLDFGLAKVRAAEAVAGMTALPTQTTPLTGEGTILGTLQYMAPEQLEGADADARTDIFALGTVIYEIATGRKAFEGKSHASLISAIMTAEPIPISTLQSVAPSVLDHVVRTCLAKEPGERWQTAHDILVELKWMAAGGTVLPAARPNARKRDRLAWVVAGCSFAALIVTWAIIHLRPAPLARAVQFEIAPRETEITHSLSFPSISPDGQYMAFDSNSGGQWRIWVHPLNSLSTNTVPGTEGGDWPFWSSDSRQIGFSTPSGLKKISLAGGTPQNICNLRAHGPGAWNHDDIILFGPGPGEPLYRVNASGGEPRALTTLDRSRQETGHYSPSFLPDGRHFIYMAWSSKPENNAAYLGSLDSPEVKRIHNGGAGVTYGPPGYLIFTRGRSLWAQHFDIKKAQLSGDPMLVANSVETVGPAQSSVFSVSETGVLAYMTGSNEARTQLVWFDRSGKRLGTVGEPANYSNPAISPDQEKVAVGKMDPQTDTRDIWVLNFQRGTGSRFTFDPGDDLNPAWSPDGSRIAFSSDRKGHRDIYVKEANGAGEEHLVLQSEENKSLEDWSSDGQYLLWTTDSAERLFSLKEHKSMPLPKFTQDHGRFSPSHGGRPPWIAYTSDETGVMQVYVRNFDGALASSGGKWQISTNGGSEPYWRGDGKELFYLEGNKLMAVEVNPNGQSFQAGNPKELFETRLAEPRRNRYDVTSDGKRFLMNSLIEERASFTVVLNWPSLLKR